MQFLKEFPGIGSKGHVASFVFSKGGKINAPGKLNHDCSVAHLNPV